MKTRLLATSCLIVGFIAGLLCIRPVAYAMEALAIVKCAGSAACTEGMNTWTGPGINGTSANGIGVVGATEHASTAAANGTYGVLGADGSKTGYYNAGVRGTSVRGTGVSGHSVIGDAFNGSSTSGNGVTGISSVSSGVQGQSSKGNGVNGFTFNPSGTNHQRMAGVRGSDYSTDNGAMNVGVYGVSQNGSALFGSALNGTGLYAETTNSGYAISAYGGPGNSVGLNVVDASTYGNPIQAISDGGGNFIVDASGNVTINGKLYSAGSCNPGCSRTHAIRSYGTTSATPSLEDVGEGAVTGGVGIVRFDRAFASAIDPNRYVVLITPEGDSRGLYVAQRSATGFVVRELMGGRSNSPFAYRIIAHPYGDREARLPYVTLPTPHRPH